MKNYTHKIVIELGIDLTEYLSPQNIIGVKSYLGVENDADIVAAIGEDQYRRIESMLMLKGFNVIGANMTSMQGAEKPIVDSRIVRDPFEKNKDSKSVENEDEGATEVEKKVLDLISNAKKQLADEAVITKISINKKYKKDIKSIEMLKTLSDLFAETDIIFKKSSNDLTIEYMDSMGRIKNITLN